MAVLTLFQFRDESELMRSIDQMLLRPIRSLVTKFCSMPRHAVWISVLFFAFPAWPFVSSEIQHRLVDAETGKAVTNAVGYYYLRSESVIPPVGGRYQTNRVLIEARADDQGLLVFPRQWIAPCLPLACSRHDYPRIYIFAPGYLPKQLVHSTEFSTAVGLWAALEWPKNGASIKLERPISKALYLKELDSLQGQIKEIWSSYNGDVQCDWQRIPQMLTAIHMESWYQKNPSSDPYAGEDNPSRLGRTLAEIRQSELNSREPHRSRIAGCKKVLDVLNKTPIRCKDGSVMKDSRWEYVPLPSIGSGVLNVFGGCIDEKAPIALIAENVRGKVHTQPKRLGLFFNGCLKSEQYDKQSIPAQSGSSFNTPASALRLTPLDAYKILRASTKLQCVEYGLLADSDYYYFYEQDLEYALMLGGEFDKKKFPDQTYAVDGMTGEFVNIAPGNAQGNF